MSDLPLTFFTTGFPSTTFAGTTQELVDAFSQYLQATVSTTNLLLGKYGGSAPVAGSPPLWVDNRTWKQWDGAAFKPMGLYIGDNLHVIQLTGTPTANRTATFPDKSGTVALTSDIYGARASINLASSTVPHEMNWEDSFSFFETISGDQAYTMKNYLPGQSIMLQLSGTHMITWPDYVLWPGGSPPAQTGTALYVFRNIAGTVYGSQIGISYA